ncbi:MAG: bifunctional DNA primase/polymerase [Microvirga sp.]
MTRPNLTPEQLAVFNRLWWGPEGAPEAAPQVPPPEKPEQKLALAVQARESLQIALILAAEPYNFAVFPIRRGTKDEYPIGGSDHGATCDPVRIKQMFEGTDHNVGLWATTVHLMVGPDHYKPGVKEAWDQLIAECGPLPATFTTRSARGGFHYWFRTGGQIFTQSAPAKDVDVRAGNGYGLAPGSWFVDKDGKGGFYELQAADAPALIPPVWAARLVRGAEGPKGKGPGGFDLPNGCKWVPGETEGFAEKLDDKLKERIE